MCYTHGKAFKHSCVAIENNTDLNSKVLSADIISSESIMNFILEVSGYFRMFLEIPAESLLRRILDRTICDYFALEDDFGLVD